MKNYTNYETEDFVQDLYFRKWVLGKLTPEDSFWPIWQRAHPEQYEVIEQARNLIIALKCDDLVTDQKEVRTAIDAILEDSKTYPMQSSDGSWVWKIAASLLLATGLGFWSFNREIISRSGAGSYSVVEVNNDSRPRSFRLSDNTLVTLFPNSQLRVDTGFGKTRRKVILTGKAFFNVARNVDKPFYVYAGEVVTKVLGTSFTVKAFESDENVSVAVRSGKVTVFKQNSKERTSQSLSEEMILVPNQQAVFEKRGARLIKTLVESPVVLNPGEHVDVLEFSDTPIPQVLQMLEEAYGVKIVFDEHLLAHCNFTARLTNEPLYEKLGLICEAIQARYEIVDGQIVIYARDCD